MKVLGIVGSPRQHGNTCDMLEAVLAGAAERGAETSLLMLGSLDIGECIGCHRCWREHECALQDDMPPLYDRIVQSDALVFGSPVYWYGATAIMKAFLDRFVYFNCPENRAKIRGKTVALVSPFEEASNDTATPLVDMFAMSFAYLELHHAGTVLAPGAGAKGDVRGMPEVLKRCRELGRKLTERA